MAKCTRNVRVDEDDEPYRKSSTATIRSEGTGTVYYNKHGGILQLYDSSDNSSLDSHRSSMMKVRRLSSTFDVTSRFPKLQECAHFHYDFVELGKIKVCLCDEEQENYRHNGEDYMERTFLIKVFSNQKSWNVRRTYKNFRLLDRQLHKCIFDRKFSQLADLSQQEEGSRTYEEMETELSSYLQRFSNIANSMLNCGTILNWFELDNRGNRLLAIDDSGINTPAIAAAHAVKRYTAQAVDEISLEVGDIVSVIDMPATEDTIWWRGKRGFEVGFFPSECVELIGDKVPSSVENRIPLNSRRPLVRKHGKFLSFLRMFFTTRPARNQLKQTGIVKERVFGCDLGEHLLNSGHDVPLVLKSCSEVIEEHGIVDGIYRLSGITSNIQKLRLAFDEDRVPDLRADIYLQDIHSISSLLKMYFRELPNPLLTYQLYDKFAEAVRDEDNKLWKIHDVVQQLPPPHYRTLEYLMRHLAKVSTNGNDTGMHSKNLAIVWAPNLLRSKELESGGGAAALQGVGIQAVVTECLIVYADLIFSDKLPSYSSPEFTQSRKKPRPKSLAISTPTKLITLEEARERALSASLRPAPHKYINVGGGPEKLPSKYHTVIDLPGYKKRMPLRDNTTSNLKGKKSPGSWRSIFTRSSGRGSIKQKGGKEDVLMDLERKAITEEDVHNWKRRRLRVAKSAESLINLPNRDHRLSRHFDDFPRINSCSDEEMSPRTKHKRSASTESPRCLLNDDYPSFIEPGSREVPIDVEMIDDSSSSFDSGMEARKERKTERKQSFVRGEEKRKPTHRRTPSGSSTPRKEREMPPPKEKKVVTKPIAQSEKLRRKNESNFEKENREKLVQKVAKSLKNEETKVIGSRSRLESIGDKEKFVLHVEDATVFNSTSPKSSDNKQRSSEERKLPLSPSTEKLKETASSKDKHSTKHEKGGNKKDIQSIGNLPESPGAKRKNWMNTSPATSPDEAPSGFYSPHKSDFSELLSDDEKSKHAKESLPKFPNLQDNLNDTGHTRSDVSPGGYDNLDSPFSSSDFQHFESRTTSTSKSVVYKQQSYEEEEYDNIHPQPNSVSPPFSSKMSKCLSVPSDIQKSLENLTSGSQTDLLSSVTISELSTSVESFSVSQSDDTAKVQKKGRRSASLDSLNDTESPLTRTLKEINAQIDKAFKNESDKGKLKKENVEQGSMNETFDFSSSSVDTIKRQSSSSDNLESHVYTDRPGAEIQVVETPQLVRKAVRPTHIAQTKLETNIDGDLLIEHSKEASIGIHQTNIRTEASEKVHFGLSEEDMINFESYKAETGHKIDMSEEDFEFFTKQARSNQSSKRHSTASSLASPMSDISPSEYRRKIVSPLSERTSRWKNTDRSDGEHTTPTNSPPITQRLINVRSPSQENVQYSPHSPSAMNRLNKICSPLPDEVSHGSPSISHRQSKVRTPSQEELYHGSPITNRPSKIRTPSQEDLSYASPIAHRPNKIRTTQDPTSPPSRRFVQNPIYTGPANTSPKSPPAKLLLKDNFADTQRLETAIDETLFQNGHSEGKESAERNFEKLLFQTSQMVDGENAVVQSPRSPRQQPRWEDLAGLNQDFVSVLKKDGQSPKSQKVARMPPHTAHQHSMESPDEVPFDKKLQDLSNFNEQWRTQLAPTGDVCRLGSHGEKLNEIQNLETKIEMERPSIQKLTERINKNYGFEGERTLRRSSTIAAMERLEEFEPRVRQRTPECSTDQQTLTLEKPMIKRCQTESNIPQIKHCTVVTQDTSSNTSSSTNSEPRNIEYEPTDFGKVLRTNFTDKSKSAIDNKNVAQSVTGGVTLPPSYPVMASSQTSHIGSKMDVPAPIETAIDGPYLNDQQIMAEVMPFNSVIDDIDFNESCFGIPTHQNLSNEMREKIQERLKAEREQNSGNIPETFKTMQDPFSNTRSPPQNVHLMEIETHFSADPYQYPVATVHFLSQGPIIHASPQVIQKLDNSEEAAQNAINADLELSMSLKKNPDNLPSQGPGILEAEVVGVSHQLVAPQQETIRNTGLENMRLVSPSSVQMEIKKEKSDLPELAPPSPEYIEEYRDVVVKRKLPLQPKTNGPLTAIPKSFSKPPLHKSYSVDYYKTECVVMDSCDEDTSDDVFVDHNKIKSKSDIKVTVQHNVKHQDPHELQNMPLTFLSETPSRSSLDESALEMASSRHEDFLPEEEDDQFTQSHQSTKLQSLKEKIENDNASSSSEVTNSNVCFRHENYNSERIKQAKFGFTSQRSYSQTEQYSSDLSDSGNNSFSSRVSGQLWQMPGSRRSISTDLGYEFRPKKIEKVTIGITNFGKPPKHRGSTRGRASSESAMSEAEMTIRFSSARTSPKTVVDGSPKSLRNSPKVLRSDEFSRGNRSPQSQRNVDVSLRFVRQKSEAGSPKSVRHVSFSENSETTHVTVTSPTIAQSETVITSESQNRMSQSLTLPINGSENTSSRKVERRGSIKELMQFFEEKTSKREEMQEELLATSQLRHCPRVRSESPNYCQTESRRNETFRHSLEIPSSSSHLEGLVRPHPVRLGPKPFYGAKQ
ncbi:ARHGAP32 [Mytilus coruscus]|uniref:ARHGAP32 n=1 Tax=Mytilus coruscus TaxID=42192 RepID=A0A6J8F3I3_MYTCO|nr:ARHGAP32 [Mytilus coruscus]